MQSIGEGARSDVEITKENANEKTTKAVWKSRAVKHGGENIETTHHLRNHILMGKRNKVTDTETDIDINIDTDIGEGNQWTKGERTMATNKYTNCHSSTTPTTATTTHLKPKLRNTGSGTKPLPRKTVAIDGRDAGVNSECITREKHSNCNFSTT